MRLIAGCRALLLQLFPRLLASGQVTPLNDWRMTMMGEFVRRVAQGALPIEWVRRSAPRGGPRSSFAVPEEPGGLHSSLAMRGAALAVQEEPGGRYSSFAMRGPAPAGQGEPGGLHSSFAMRGAALARQEVPGGPHSGLAMAGGAPARFE